MSDKTPTVTHAQFIKKVGRKGKYNQYTVKEIIKYLKRGYTQRDSAQMAGISQDTLYTWMNQYPEFSELVHEAIIKRKHVLIKRIEDHAKRDWKAPAWLLERQFPQEYSVKTITELQGKIDTTITVNVLPYIPHGASKEELERIKNAYGVDNFTKGMESHLNAIQGSIVEDKEDIEPQEVSTQPLKSIDQDIKPNIRIDEEDGQTV